MLYLFMFSCDIKTKGFSFMMKNNRVTPQSLDEEKSNTKRKMTSNNDDQTSIRTAKAKSERAYFLPNSGFVEKIPTIDTTDESRLSRWARIKFKEFESEAPVKQTGYLKLDMRVKRLRIKFKQLLQRFERLIPWYSSLKYIERTYGLSYLSFFKFIQWLFIFNLFIGIISTVFVVLPQVVYGNTPAPENYTYLETNNLTLDEACPSILLNASFFNIFTDQSDEKLVTQCCTRDYEAYLDILVKKETTWEKLLDIIQGTGLIEDTLLFYGHYNNHTVFEATTNGGTRIKHVYYMGLAFVLVAIISLLFSAVSILFRLGSGLKSAIIKSSDSKGGSELCKQIFCSWDYRISDKTFAKKFKKTIRKYLQDEVEEIKLNQKRDLLKFSEKFCLYLTRFSIFSFIILLLGASGYGIYSLQKVSLQSLATSTSDIERLLFEFLPAIGIKALNFIFPIICYQLAIFEQYSGQKTLFLYLMRTGVVRLVSLMFLFASVTDNIFENKNYCASQDNTLLSTAIVTSNSTSPTGNTQIKCWETYVGQQFYKLIILDFITQIATTFFVEFPIARLASYFKKLEVIQSEFDLGIRFLDVLYVQTIFWSSFFFSPLLSVIAAVYYFITFYLKLFSLRFNTKLTEKKEMQSRSNVAFFLVLFLVFLFILITAGLIFSAVKPSRSCGPFRLHDSSDFYIYTKLRDELNDNAPPVIRYIFNVVFSYLFILLVSCVFLIIIWIFYNYSKAHIAMGKAFRKIITEERNKNNALLKEVTSLERKISKIKSKKEELTAS